MPSSWPERRCAGASAKYPSTLSGKTTGSSFGLSGEEGVLSISDGTVSVGTRALSAEDGTVFGAAGVAVEGANTLGVPDGTVRISCGS